MKFPPELKTFLLALFTALFCMAGWEIYVRSLGFPTSQEDDKGLWAWNRARLDNLGKDDVLILGSSRVHFDLQLDVWEEVTGVRPMTLAAGGKTPSPFLQDMVENTEFNGTLILGVAPGLFFSPPGPQSGSWRNTSKWLNHFYERTYAQRLNQALFIPLNSAFAFIMNTEEETWNQLTLRAMVNHIPVPARIESEKDPEFPFFSYVDVERNTYMWERMETDTAYARQVKDMWAFFASFPPGYEERLEEQPCTLDFYESMFLKFQRRGGRVILVRSPAYGIYTLREKESQSKELYWDSLLSITGVPGYHYREHAFMDQYELPEWSHMSVPQARQYTRDLTEKMLEDGVLSSHK